MRSTRSTRTSVDPKTGPCGICGQMIGEMCVSVMARGKKKVLKRCHSERYAAVRVASVATTAKPTHKKPRTKPSFDNNIREVLNLGALCGGFSPVPLSINGRVADVPVDKVYELAQIAAPTLLCPPSSPHQITEAHERGYIARHRAGDRSARIAYLTLVRSRIVDHAKKLVQLASEGDVKSEFAKYLSSLMTNTTSTAVEDESVALAVHAFGWWNANHGRMIDFILREVERLLLKRLRHRAGVEALFWAHLRPTNNVSEVCQMVEEVVGAGGKRRGFSLIPLEFRGRVIETDLVRAGSMGRHLGATMGPKAPSIHQNITLEHEQSYVARFALGDTAAAWEFININASLIIKLAKKARRFLPTNDLADEDLLAEGRVGAFDAFKKWDPNSGKFSTYAYAWILSHLQGKAAKGGSTIGVRQEVHLGLSRGRKEGRVLSESEAALERALHVGSIDEKVGGEDGKERSAIAALAADVDVEEDVSRQEYQAKIRACIFTALEDLSTREREIVLRRMYASDDAPITLEQIGREFGVSRERVRQIETTAHQKLKALMEKNFGGKNNIMVGMS